MLRPRVATQPEHRSPYTRSPAMEIWMHQLLDLLALPQFGLSTVFIVAFISATLLPVVGDPLCAVAGWLRMPFWPCLLYMAIGKFFRYASMTAGLLYLVPGDWVRWLHA